jgi:hypothetical protein
VAAAVLLASGAGWVAGKRAAGAAAGTNTRRSPAPAMQLFGKAKPKDGLPPGWKKVPSQSRPGQFSYLNTKTKKRYDRLPANLAKGNFYDDEADTIPDRFAFWKADPAEDEESPEEFMNNLGFAEGGRDLATDGLLIYAAFIPFLLLVFAYSTGAFSFGYSTGNY